tara:strand:+ start:20596 stop:21033 length:438 start_codon:yes stop_codon:yes gene_type:complete
VVEMEIREMSIGDVQEVYEIGSSDPAFMVAEESSTFWPTEILEGIVNSDSHVSLVLYDDGVKAFLLATYDDVTKKGVVEGVWVNQDWSYRGSGRKLLNEVEKRLREKGAMYLCALVDESNIQSRNMCNKFGFYGGKSYVWMHKEY